MKVKNPNSLQKFVRVSSNLTGATYRCVTQFCEQQVLRKTRSIILNGSHEFYSMSETLPLGRHFRCPSAKIVLASLQSSHIASETDGNNNKA